VLLYNHLLAKKLMAEIINAPMSAGTKPSTLKPCIKVEINQKRNALIIKVNRPRVRILMGKVRRIMTGRTIILNNPQIMEIMRAI